LPSAPFVRYTEIAKNFPFNLLYPYFSRWVQITLSFVFAIFATLVFVFQTFATVGTEKAILPPTSTVEMADRLRMKEWRNDRNWWISLFACTIWLLCWRIQVWTKRYCLVDDSPTSSRRVSPKPKLAKKSD
jgi:hypothetical protein